MQAGEGDCWFRELRMDGREVTAMEHLIKVKIPDLTCL